jgi:hypothetical protein
MFFAPPFASAAGFTVNTSGSALSGLWWNQSESGWGMSLTQQGPIVFVAWYAYDASGTPLWYVMSNCGVFADGCSGELYKVSGGTPPTIPWNGAAKLVTKVGTGTLAFADVNSATFNYVLNGVAGSRNIVRQVFASGASAPAVDYTALWWNADESGWGVALTQQYGTIFATWYTYDASGNPVWYVASNCVVIGSGCSGDLFQVTGGTPPTAIWNGAGKQTAKIGSISFTFSGSAAGTMSYTVNGASGSKSISRQIFYTAPAPVTLGSFHGNIVLGSPTETSVRANVFSPDQGGLVYLVYGTTPGVYDKQTVASTLITTKPLELAVDGLSANTRYYYRLQYQSAAGTGSGPTEEYTFHTARPAGSTFTFAIQGDSHPERELLQFNPDLYRRTLLTAATDNPDFYLTIGDDFSVDTLDPATINAAKVTERYTIQRPYLGLIGRSAPVFLVNGNHEQAARYLLDGTPNNVAVWAQNARNTHYSQPASDGFYSGNTEQIPYIGLLRNYFAWTWGDALFVTIDPYWESATCVDNAFGGGSKRTSLWDVTHGDQQYQWLKKVLEQSRAKYKFVFAHHVMGSQRGGIELADTYEWGGRNANGTWGFTTNRPTWSLPIHQLLAANRVTIFFQGHDHIWVRQQLDGVTYQTLSEPADPFYALYNSDAYVSGDKLPNTGYTRVTVSPAAVKVDYVRTYLPVDEGPGKTSGATAFSYSIQ